jgi:hypothetical protein
MAMSYDWNKSETLDERIEVAEKYLHIRRDHLLEDIDGLMDQLLKARHNLTQAPAGIVCDLLTENFDHGGASYTISELLSYVCTSGTGIEHQERLVDTLKEIRKDLK